MNFAYRRLLPLAGAIGLSLGLMAGSADAARIVATGHDSDLHGSGEGLGSPPDNQILGMLNYVRATAPNPTLQVLSFDAGSQLTSVLTALGIAFTNVNPNTGVPSASLFNTATFSAIIVASDSTCGGCDNGATSANNLQAAASSFASFFNNGGGIVALAGGSRANYYSFLPETAAPFGSPGSTGYYQTAAGAAAGIPAVNGDPTHNFFTEPGTGGTSSLWQVAERNTLGTASTADDPAETIFLSGGTIVCPVTGCVIITDPGTGGTGVPEPGSLALVGLGLAGLAGIRRRKQQE
jgi:hypothetical protein